MTTKNLFTSLLLFILGGVVTYLGIIVYYPRLDTSLPTNSTPTIHPLPYASNVLPKIDNTESFESCNQPSDCIIAAVKQIDNPSKSVMQCLNQQILAVYPEYTPSQVQIADTEAEASCSCQQNVCQFTLK